jgi:WD40 repeat protein
MPDTDIRQAVTTLTQALLDSASPEVASALAQAVTIVDDPNIRAGLLDALRDLQTPACTDVICATWADTRHPELAALLTTQGWTADEPGDLAILTALKAGHVEPLRSASTAQVPALLHAAQDEDAAIRQNATLVLESLTDAATRELLCQKVIEEDDPTARQIAVSAGYKPRSTQDRALFYLLTEQWDAYQTLDFDANLLRTIYDAADESLRRRIGDFARRAGHVEFVQILAGDRRQRQLAALTTDEWHVIISLLTRHGAADQMWQLAQMAPAVWSKRLLQQMAAHHLRPSAAGEQPGWEELVTLASACEGEAPPLGGLARRHIHLTGHTGKVWDISFAPRLPHDIEAPAAGPMLISAGKDGTIRFWSPWETEALKTLSSHTDSVEHLAVMPAAPGNQGHWLISSGDNWLPAPAKATEGVQVWRLSSGEALATLPKSGPAFLIPPWHDTEDAQQRQVITGGKDGSLRWWSLPDGRPLRRSRRHRKAVNRLVATADPAWMVSGSEDGSILLWTPDQDAPTAQLNGHTGAIWDMRLYPQAQLLVSASHDHTIRLWRIPDGEAVQTLTGHEHGVSNLLLGAQPLPDGERQMFSASTDNTIRLWRLPDGSLMNVLPGRGPIATSPDGHILAGRGADGAVWLWQLPQGTPLTTLDMGARLADTLLTGRSVTCLAFSDDGRWLANGCNDGTIWLWTSDLIELCQTPISQTTISQLQWAQEAADNRGLSSAERGWLAFTLGLLHWRRRYDIEVEELPTHITIGEFDIEVE